MTLLDALGWERPQMAEIGVNISYATAVVEIPRDAPADWKFALTLSDPPHSALHAVMVPTEDGRWIVTIADHSATTWIETWDAFLEASHSLITPTVYNALRYAEPPEGIRHYRFPVSTWKYFERLPRLPRGLLPVADALCRFNPIHAQGMSSAAKQARLLQDVLRRTATEPDPIASLQAEFMAEVASVLETPWAMSTSADLAFPQTRGERPENFEEARQFEATLFRTAAADPVVHRAVIEVAQLLQPHQRLREPDILRRIEAAAGVTMRKAFSVLTAGFLTGIISLSTANASNDCLSAANTAKAEWRALSHATPLRPSQRIRTVDGRELSGSQLNYAGALINRAESACESGQPEQALSYVNEAKQLLHPVREFPVMSASRSN